MDDDTWKVFLLKFVYSEKATEFCEISTLLLSTVHTDKSKVEILQNFVAFSEYMNFKIQLERVELLNIPSEMISSHYYVPSKLTYLEFCRLF